MTYKEAAGLKVGDRVMWRGDSAGLGTVEVVLDGQLRVVWDDVGSGGWIRYELAHEIARAPVLPAEEV